MAGPAEQLTAAAAEAVTRQPTELTRCLCSYAASMMVIVAGACFYISLSPYYAALYRLSWRPTLGGHALPFTIDTVAVLWSFAALYALVLPPYYALRRGRWSNAWVLIAASWRIGRRKRWQVSEAEKQAMLCLLLKFIFIPFCLHGLFAYLAFINDRLLALPDELAARDWFAFYNEHLHILTLNVIFLVDFLPFVVGYLVQARALDNEVVSVDASAGGWMACLACYPPFNTAVVLLLPWQIVELAPVHPTFSTTAHMIINGMLLAFFACYA